MISGAGSVWLLKLKTENPAVQNKGETLFSPHSLQFQIIDFMCVCFIFYSWWLKKTQNGSSRLSRWVWVVAFVIILCIAGVSVLGWRASQNKPAHQAPTALGGSANERPGATTSSSAPVASGSSGAQQSSIKHVSPTHTVARREAQPTGVAVPLGHARAARRRLFDSVVAH